MFRVKATGKDLQFQWQKNCSDLCDGDRYFGTNTGTLHILEVENREKGRYRCLVKNTIGEKFSDEALLNACKLVINACGVYIVISACWQYH